MIVVVLGPTGVGKTKMSINLAKSMDAIVINADAVQVYKELDIGSAKVTKAEMDGIPHYLLDIKSPNEEYSVKDYQDDLRHLLAKFKNRNIIIVGGTGLYICAGLMDYHFGEDIANDTYEELSNDELYELVLKKDSSTQIDSHNRLRMIRFLNRGNNPEVASKLLYDNVYFIGLTTNRDNLYNIINKRVDKMLADGLVDEVKTLYAKYPNALILKRAIGYKEIVTYLNGNITYDEAVEEIKKNSRHYAKRQYTWFNNKMSVTWFDVNYNDFNITIDEVKKYLFK